MPQLEMKLLSGTDEERDRLQSVLNGAPAYFSRLIGQAARATEALLCFSEIPPGKTREDKFVVGFFCEGEMVGCADLIRGYPDGRTAFLGLLLFSEKHQRTGRGEAAYEWVENLVREWKSIDKIRLAVVLTNDSVMPFWKRMGFVDTGERKPYRHEMIRSEHVFFEKSLSGSNTQVELEVYSSEWTGRFQSEEKLLSEILGKTSLRSIISEAQPFQA